MNVTEEKIALTQYSRGAGCGCKIAPKALEEILSGNFIAPDNRLLLVGNDSKDDAAVYDLGDGRALISTTDFFTPVVDDAVDFGRIAAANAISDVYAMGGKPFLALAILGWPVEKLPTSLARKVIEGARSICAEAGIPLAGGHSIDSSEPIFGLAVSGSVDIRNLKKNNTAEPGDFIFLTKAIGVGILTTAEKRKALLEEHSGVAVKQMIRLNSIGSTLGTIESITAMTDVTGFGLGGHLMEMAEGSNTTMEIEWKKVPVMQGLAYYLSQRIFPDATSRNWSAYGSRIGFRKGVPVAEAFSLLPDPQTNGGLLFTVNEKGLKEVQELLKQNGMSNHLEPIGRVREKGEKLISII